MSSRHHSDRLSACDMTDVHDQQWQRPLAIPYPLLDDSDVRRRQPVIRVPTMQYQLHNENTNEVVSATGPVVADNQYFIPPIEQRGPYAQSVSRTARFDLNGQAGICVRDILSDLRREEGVRGKASEGSDDTGNQCCLMIHVSDSYLI